MVGEEDIEALLFNDETNLEYKVEKKMSSATKRKALSQMRKKRVYI